MKSIRSLITAVAFAAIGTSAIAFSAQAAQPFGRDSVQAGGNHVAAGAHAQISGNQVPGRQGGLPADTKAGMHKSTDKHADDNVTTRAGRA